MLASLLVLGTMLWPAVVHPTLPSQLHGYWCRGEGAYLRVNPNGQGWQCPPTDRFVIEARQVIFHEDTCEVRSAVRRPNTRRTHFEYHTTLNCRQTAGPPSEPPQVEAYWLGLFRRGGGGWGHGDLLFMHKTNMQFEPLDYRRFLREHPSD